MSIAETPMPPYPWQADIWQNFYERVSKKRIAHALLVSGVEGLGVEPLAFAMARYLMCLSPLEDVACGRCRSCELLSADTHPDLFVLRTEEKATQIKVDQVRACVDFVAKTSFADGPKVVVVEHADEMNVNASNALLKSLEEPQGHTIFILTTNRLSSILPTIRSRCQSTIVKSPTEAQAASWLDEQGLSYSESLLQQAGGAPVLVKQWLDSDYLSLQSEVTKAICDLLEYRTGAMNVSVTWQSMELATLLQLQIQTLEACLKARFSETQEAVGSGLHSRLLKIDASYLFRLRDKFLTKLSLVRSSANLNAAMLTEELALDWVAISKLAQR